MHYGRPKFNAEEWREEHDTPEEITDECLESLWHIMATFVEIAWDKHQNS
jgi:hypothetical protein